MTGEVRNRRLLWAVALAALAAGAGTAWLIDRSVVRDRAVTAMTQRPRVTGNFALLDTDGRRVSWSELGGRHQLVFFGFTHCPAVCPTTLLNAAAALQSIGPSARDTGVLFISVDPERDTPAVVGNYVRGFGPTVHGFTGDATGIAAAAAAFKVHYSRVPLGDGDYMMNHTATLFLLGPRDEILELIPAGSSTAEIAAAVARHL